MVQKTYQTDLFNTEHSKSTHLIGQQPLAHRARPQELDQFKGHQKLFQRYPFLEADQHPSLILWGPPGSGKTTLARLLAKRTGKELFPFNAVLGGVQDLKKIIKEAQEVRHLFQKEPVIFIDEIHRFNKAQQDALLPYVESGDFTLIGATTENPKVSVNRALISRVQLVELPKLSLETLKAILDQAQKRFQLSITEEARDYISRYAGGDARRALNSLEALEVSGKKTWDLKEAQELIHGQARDYDKNRDRHYDVISAFIKSMRGSDPDSTLLWLAVMLDGGEDPVFIARRMIIFASEDIGNADPQALSLATATLIAVQNIGMPEGRINLGHCATYLASTVKSNASYMAINRALEFVRKNSTIEVPTHLRNQHPDIKSYRYPHDHPHHFVNQSYSPEEVPQFYYPSEVGTEKRIKERLEQLWN